MLRDDWYNLHRNDDPENGPDRKKKWKNWWYYNKWIVLGAVVLALLAFDFGRSLWIGRHNIPDFQVAYVGSPMPDSTLDALEAGLASVTPDLNGDGKIIVQVNSYGLCLPEGSPEPDPQAAYAEQVKFIADLQTGNSFLFLMEDPEQFQRDFEILYRLDGTFPADTPDSAVPMWVSWEDCPTLTALDLGKITGPIVEGDIGTNQQLMAHLAVGHRMPNTKDNAYNEACEALFQSLIAQP